MDLKGKNAFINTIFGRWKKRTISYLCILQSKSRVAMITAIYTQFLYGGELYKNLEGAK